MNRHVVPSMLLSVLIVCFFAVILFENDSSRGKVRAVNGKKTGAEHIDSAPHGTNAKPVEPHAEDSKQKPKEEQKPEQSERRPTAEPTPSPVPQAGAASSS